MPRYTTPQYTIVAALAAGAVLASPASARPTDNANRLDSPTSSLAGTVSPRQDMRGEYAREAERVAEAPIATGLPAPPLRPAPVPEAPKTAPAADTGGDDDVWLVLGIGLAGAGIVAGGAAGVARQHRLRVRRVAA